MTDQHAAGADIRSMSFSHSRQLVDWMIEETVSFAFTSYQTGRVFLVGVDEKRQLSMMQRSFTRPQRNWFLRLTLAPWRLCPHTPTKGLVLWKPWGQGDKSPCRGVRGGLSETSKQK